MENMSYAQFGYAAFTPTTQVSLNYFISLITIYRNFEKKKKIDCGHFSLCYNSHSNNIKIFEEPWLITINVNNVNYT